MTCPRCGCDWAIAVRPVDYADDASPWIAECQAAGCQWQSKPIQAADRTDALTKLIEAKA